MWGNQQWGPPGRTKRQYFTRPESPSPLSACSEKTPSRRLHRVLVGRFNGGRPHGICVPVPHSLNRSNCVEKLMVRVVFSVFFCLVLLRRSRKNNTYRTQEHGLLNVYGSAAARPFLSGAAAAAALLSFPSLSISIFSGATTIFNLLPPFESDLAAIRRSPRPESPLNRIISQLLKSRPGSSQPSSPEENPPPKRTTREPEEHPLPNMLPQRKYCALFLQSLYLFCLKKSRTDLINPTTFVYGSIGLRSTHPFTNSISIILNKMLYKRKLFDNPAQVGTDQTDFIQ
ncbi:hypothetical protein VPH35_080773 [Triticum aestivum]